MKRVALLMAFTGLAFLQSNAQTTQKESTTEVKAARKELTPEEQAENQTRHAVRQLGLTDEQKKQYQAFALEKIKANRAAHERAKATDDREVKLQARAESKAATDKFDANVKSILTAEQLTKWEAMKQRKMERKKENIEQRRVIQDNNE